MIKLNVGSSTVSESVSSGWTLAAINCVYNGESVGDSIAGGEEINIDEGDNVVCTFTNIPSGKISGKKFNEKWNQG